MTPQPLRVLQVTPRVAPFVGGVETHVREVSRRLAALGVDVSIVTLNVGGQLAADDHLDGVPVRRVGAHVEAADLFFSPELYRYVRRGGFDVLHVQSYHTLVAPTAMAAAHRAGLPYVVTFHGGGHSSGLRNRVRAAQITALGPLLRRAAALVAIADFEIRHYGRRIGVPEARWVKIPNGADLPTPSPNHSAPPGTLIVSPARLEEYKGHHRVLRAFPHVLKEIPDARLWIAGRGPFEEHLRALSVELGVADRVEISVVDRQVLADRLSKASLATLISDFESHPLAALEAISLGIPVVLANNSGMAELASRGLARAVELTDSPEMHAAAMVQQIRNPVSADVHIPSWDECAAELRRLYERIATESLTASASGWAR
ncbi:MAG: glycosyl transferase family 1 [Conexibacter sp.]|nr:glycosyl transferase family 1 [Conexibacter sp.]